MAGNQVTFKARLKQVGLPALIIAVSLLVSLGCGERITEEPEEEPGLVVEPDTSRLEVSNYQQFETSFDGQKPVVRWYVDDVLGGDPWKGMITVNGLYVAPSAVPDGGIVTIRAEALQDPDLKGTATVMLGKGAGTPYITVEPETLTVLASRSAQFQSAVYGCGSVDVIWSLELVRGIPTAGLGTIEGDGTYDAPASSNDTFVLLVRATGLDCSDRSGIARVMVPAQPRAFLVELENFTAGFDIPGSKVLKSEHCGSASGGMSVVGMDRSGEHIEVPMTVRGAGRYLAYVGYAAESGDFIRVKVEVEGCGASGTATDFELKEGTGTG